MKLSKLLNGYLAQTAHLQNEIFKGGGSYDCQIAGMCSTQHQTAGDGGQVIKECVPCKTRKRDALHMPDAVSLSQGQEINCRGRKHYCAAQEEAGWARLRAPALVIRTICGTRAPIISQYSSQSPTAAPGSRLPVFYSLSPRGSTGNISELWDT